MKTIEILFYNPSSSADDEWIAGIQRMLRFPCRIRVCHDRRIEEGVGVPRDVDVLITSRLTPPMVDVLKNLRLVCSWSIGIEEMCDEYLKKKGIAFVKMKGTHGSAIAEYTLGMMILWQRKLPYFMNLVRSGKWTSWQQRGEMITSELSGKTVGVLGLGSTGREVCIRARAFDMNIVGICRSKTNCDSAIVHMCFTSADIVDAMPLLDYLSINLPLTEETRDLISWNEFKHARPHLFVINTSRAKIINRNALEDALRRRAIGGIALDVFDQEPPRAGDPLLQHDNVFPTPHIAGYTYACVQKKINALIENLNSYGTGGFFKEGH